MSDSFIFPSLALFYVVLIIFLYAKDKQKIRIIELSIKKDLLESEKFERDVYLPFYNFVSFKHSRFYRNREGLINELKNHVDSEEIQTALKSLDVSDSNFLSYEDTASVARYITDALDMLNETAPNYPSLQKLEKELLKALYPLS